MIRRDVLVLCLLYGITPAAWSQIGLVGKCTASSTTICTPAATGAAAAYQAGDLAVIETARTGAATAPGTPTGATSVTTATVTGAIGYRLSCRVMPPGPWPAMTSTSASYNIVKVYRGTNIFGGRSCGALGTPQKNSSTGSTSYAYHSLTLTNDGGAGTSWVGGLMVLNGASTNGLAAPTGLTQEACAGTCNNGPGQAGMDTAGAVSSFGTLTQTGDASRAYATATYEINAAPAAPAACSGTCTSFVDGRPLPSNLTGAVAYSSIRFPLMNPSLAGNGVICGFTYLSTSSTTPTLVTDQSESLTVVNFGNDGSQTIGAAYRTNVAAGTRYVTLGMPAAENQISGQCIQVKGLGVADGAGQLAYNLGTNVLSTGAVTPSQAGDLIYVFFAPSTNNLCCGGQWTWMFPAPGFRLTPPANQLGVGGAILSTSSSSAITPAVYVSPANLFNMVAVPFKSAAGGTSPPANWVPCASLGTLSSNPAIQQGACPFAGGYNLVVSATDASTAQTTISSMTDSLGSTGATVHAPSGGAPQEWYIKNITVSNPDAYWSSVATTGASSEFLQTYYVSNAAAEPLDGYATASGSQAAKGGAACVDNANSNTSVSAAPGTNTAGVMIDVMYTGEGPACSVSSADSQFLAWWGSGMTDGDNGYNGGGTAIKYYSSNAAQAITYNWANPAASGPSTHNNLAGLFKFAPASPTTKRRRVLVMQ